MDETAERNEDWQKLVTDVMDTFGRDTEAIFRKFQQKCDESGYHIEREQFMSLVMERMNKAFDNFRSEMEEKEQCEIQNLNENFHKEVNELAEATKMLIEQKAAQSDPARLAGRQKFLDFLEQYTSNVFDTNAMAPKSANIKRNGKDSMIVSMEMSSTSTSLAAHKFTKSKRRQMMATVKSQCSGKNGAKMTVTSRQMIITKRKKTTISISGISIERSTNEPTADDIADMTSETDTKMDKPTESPPVPEFIKYSCVHCHDVKHWIETFNALKDVYAHWMFVHAAASDFKPFQYYVVECFACYHCTSIGTHYELVKHHKVTHPTMSFAIVSQCDRQQCALCPYSGTGIVAHFQTMHKFILKTMSVRRLRNACYPFCWDNHQLDIQLNRKLHKKLKCGSCSEILDTERELCEHHSKNHKSQKMTIKEFYDSNMHLICNCCNRRIDRNLYLNHIENRAIEFTCHQCTFRTNDLVELVKHDENAHGHSDSFKYRCMQYKNRLKRDYLQTRVIFGNGLVVSKQNLLGTKYDDSKQFEVFVDKLLEIKKERHDKGKVEKSK